MTAVNEKPKLRRVLNLGAGTQSSVLAVMCDRGELPPVEVALFADTQAEPKEVYDHLDWLEKQLKRTPIVRLTNGNLETDAIAFRRHRYSEDASTGRKGYASIPLFVMNPDGSQGIIRRQCTAEYKITPIQRYIRREMLGLADGQRAPKGVHIEQVFGISFDERQRMRRPEVSWCVYDYPLVDLKLGRWQVIEKAEKWFPDRVFPRSACYFCPYKSNEEWRRLRDDHPAEWAKAVAFDHAIRDAGTAGQEAKKMLVGKPFLHRQMVPLDKADLRDDDDKTGQMKFPGLMGVAENECEGMCGV
jgi:hypothetical protein